MHTTANPEVLLPRSSISIAWILFGVAVISGIGVMFVQKQRSDVAALRTAALADSEKSARTQLAESVSANHALEVKLQDMTAENSRLKAKVASVASAHIAAVEPKADKATSKKAKKSRKHHKHG